MGAAGDARLDRAGQGARRREQKNGVAEWRGFINVNLDASQKSQFDDWVASGDPVEIMADAVASGCHIAIKLNQDGGGFMASITQRNPASVNAGLAVTARSGEAWKALYRALFLVAVLGVDADWGKGQAPADPDRW